MRKKFFLDFFHSRQEAQQRGVATQHPGCRAPCLCDGRTGICSSFSHEPLRTCTCTFRDAAVNLQRIQTSVWGCSSHTPANTSTATHQQQQRGRHKKKKKKQNPVVFHLAIVNARKHKSRWNAAGWPAAGLDRASVVLAGVEPRGALSLFLEEWTLPRNLSTPSVMQATAVWCSQHHTEQIVWHCGRGGEKQSRTTR